MNPTSEPTGSPSADLKCCPLDYDGRPVFADSFQHRTATFENEATESSQTIDIIEAGGNIWFNASDVLDAMGFAQHPKGGHGKRLMRISHPDKIKIADTPFRFADGRRNRGSLISPRAVLKFAEGGTQGFNPFKAIPFTEWMETAVIPDGSDAAACSPAVKPPITVEPVFRAVVRVKDEDEQGNPLDPLRPVGVYRQANDNAPLGQDEVEFCLCEDERNGIGKCWCGGWGGVRDNSGVLNAKPMPPHPDDDDFEVIDYDDVGPWD